MKDSNYKILIAGKSEDTKQCDVLRQIAQTSSNIELHIGYLSEEDYVRYIHEIRYCILNYKGDYEDRSSGVVLDALFNGIPVVGRRCKALQFIEAENLGYLFDDIRTFDPEKVLNEALYTKFQKGIREYLKKQRTYRNKVIDFLGLR